MYRPTIGHMQFPFPSAPLHFYFPYAHQLGPTATIKKQQAEEEKDEEEVEEEEEEDGTMGKKEAMEIRGGIHSFLKKIN